MLQNLFLANPCCSREPWLPNCKFRASFLSKEIEKMKKKSCRVSKYLRKAYRNASTNCLWRFEYCLHKTLIIVSLIFSYGIWEGRTEIKVSQEISHRSINLSHIIQAQRWLRTWKYCDNSIRNTKIQSSKIWQDIQCMKSRFNSL